MLDSLRRAESSATVGCWTVLQTTSVAFRDQLLLICIEAGYSAFFDLLCRKRELAAADVWSVYYSDDTSATVPELRLADVQRAQYDGSVWCVTVEHPDHLVIAQRAHEAEQADGARVVTKASMPVVVGQCIQREPYNWSEAMYVSRAQPHATLSLSISARGSG